MSSRVNLGSGEWDLRSQTWDFTVRGIMGRGIKRTPEVVERFLALVEEGKAGCEVSKRDDMPAWGTWCDWCDADPELAGKYERARARGVATEEAELLAVARSAPADAVAATAQRTLVDTLKWHLSKRLPRDFGDRQQVDVNGKLTLDSIIAETIAQKPKAD